MQGEVFIFDDFQVVEVGFGVFMDDYFILEGLELGQVVVCIIVEGEFVLVCVLIVVDCFCIMIVVIESGIGIFEDVQVGIVVEVWSVLLFEDGCMFDVLCIFVVDVVVCEVFCFEGVLVDICISFEVVIGRVDVVDVFVVVIGGVMFLVVFLEFGE